VKKNLLSLMLLPFTVLMAQNISISPDKRYLQRSDKQPFVWIGDTAWELFHRLDREQATEYLANRPPRSSE
jgi:hypothetical protein